MFAFVLLALAASTLAQSTNAGSGGCGTNITYTAQWFQIRWLSYCDTKITNSNTSAPIHRASFADCSLACISEGYGCMGFAFDRSSHFGNNNCYLNPGPISASSTGTEAENAYFDSALIDPGSLPITNASCATVGSNGIYNHMNLFCDQQILVNESQIINTNFASSINDCVDLCRNCDSSSGCALPCQAITWDSTLHHGYDNCYMMPQGYLAPVEDVSWDSATLVGTQGLPNTNSTVTNGTSTSSGSGSPTPTRSGDHKEHKVLSGAAIAGIALGGVVAGIIVFAAIFWLMFHHARRSRAAHAERKPPMREVIGVKNELPSDNSSGSAVATNYQKPVSNRVVPTVKPVSAADVKGKGRAAAGASELSSDPMTGPSTWRNSAVENGRELPANDTTRMTTKLRPNESSDRWG